MKDRITLCHGCYDLLHPGHVAQLQEAKKLGGVLVVSVTSDRYVNKGPGRPLFPASERAAMLSALSCVDLVIINDEPNAVGLIHKLQPTFYVKGLEYKYKTDRAGYLDAESKAVNFVGGELVFIGDIKYSSTRIMTGELLKSKSNHELIGRLINAWPRSEHEQDD